MRISDCVRCGGGVGRVGTDLCHRCRAADQEAARRESCPTCGRFLRLSPDTGRCVTCSRTCVDCGHPVRRKIDTRCLACRHRHHAAEKKQHCPRCGKPGFLREATGWCGNCSRPGPPPMPLLSCAACGLLGPKHPGGLCDRCWQRHPDRARNQTDNLAARLDDSPWWLGAFAEFTTERFSMGRACVLISSLGGLLVDGEPSHPQALLERARWAGRSAGPLARTLDDFFAAHQLAFGLDQAARLAAGRRQRRVDATPEPLRLTVRLFCDHMVRSRERALRAGTHPRADSTIESTLGIVRDLAIFLVEERAKTDWATVQTGDIEGFLNTQPANRRRRLSSLRQFFRWARRNKTVLVDPTSDITVTPSRGFTGDTLTVAEQRRLFRRWTTSDGVHPHEAVVGLLALLHALSLAQMQTLRVTDIDLDALTLRVAGRPHPVPLDPPTFGAVGDCLLHRQAIGTPNSHLIVTKVTKARMSPPSSAYPTHLLDPAGIRIRTLRSTRLVDLIVSLDPKLVAADSRYEPRRAPRLPRRPRRPSTPRRNEPVNVRRHLAHLSPNLCALATPRLVVKITEPFRYRRDMTWKRAAASSAGMDRCGVGDRTPCDFSVAGLPVPARRTGRARSRASGSPHVHGGVVVMSSLTFPTKATSSCRVWRKRAPAGSTSSMLYGVLIWAPR